MSGTRLRSSVVLLALVACACSATARGIGAVPAPARQPSVTTDVVYGHKDGLALTFDVHRPAQPNGAGVIAIVDADTVVPMVEGETMDGALTKAGVPASFIRIEGAGHGLAGADLERANAAMVQWFERHLGSAAK